MMMMMIMMMMMMTMNVDDDDDDDDYDDDECGDNCTATCPLGGDWARMCSPRPVR